MNDTTMPERRGKKFGARAGRALLLLCLAALSGAAAPLPPADSEGLTLRIVNPIPPGALPAAVRLKLLDRDGSPVAALERKIDEKGFIAGIPPIAGVVRISADADLFDTTTALFAVARESGIVLLPYGKLALSGFVDPSGPRIQGEARLWLRRRSDGKLLRRTEPIGPGNAVSILIPGGEWDVVLKAPAKAPVTGAASLPPGVESRVSLDRAPSGLAVNIRSVQTDGTKPVPRASVRWNGLAPLTIREITLHAPPTAADELLALSINDDGPTTDAAGSLRLEHLPVQPHVWTLTADGYRTARHSVEVRANDAQKSVIVAMRPLPDILVSVEDRAANPLHLVVDVSVRVPGTDTALPLRPVWSGRVASGAVQRLSRVKELEYRFDLRDESKVLLFRTWISPTDKVWQQDAIPVRLVHEPRTVRGKVTRGEEPLAGVFVFPEVQTRGGPEVEHLIPIEKFVELAPRSAPDGSYSMQIGGPGIFLIRYSMPDEHVDGVAGTVDLTTATSAELDFSIARNRLALDVFSAKDGKPIPRADLQITMGRPTGSRGPSYETQTDDQGHYVAAGLDFVRASVRVSAEGYETRTVDLPVEEFDESKEPVRIDLQPVGALRFRVGDARGVPIFGAEVVILEEEAPGDIEPPHRTITRSDASGLAVVEHPAGDSRPYFFLARGWQLELVTAQASEDAPEIPVVLTPIQSTYPLRIRRPTGEPYAFVALAFRRFGVLYPWTLLGQKVVQEGRDNQGTLITDAGGWILVHSLLAPGSYDTFLFSPADMRTRMRHFAKPLGPLTLPLQTETTLTSSRDAIDGGRR